MIAHLRGSILEKHPNRIVVDVNGVGYDVFVPLSTFYGLGDPGFDIALRIHTHVREDALTLYGFATLLEQELFERLIGVSGIGPKLALAVLSGIEPIELMRAIERGDIARLTAIPGVGKKTSERIVLELKDRLPRAQVRAIEPKQGLVVTVDAEGKIYLDQAGLSYDDFAATFPAFVRTKRPTGVYLRADGRVAYARVVQVLAVIRSSGVQDVGLVAEPETINR